MDKALLPRAVPLHDEVQAEAEEMQPAEATESTATESTATQKDAVEVEDATEQEGEEAGGEEDFPFKHLGPTPDMPD